MAKDRDFWFKLLWLFLVPMTCAICAFLIPIKETSTGLSGRIFFSIIVLFVVFIGSFPARRWHFFDSDEKLFFTLSRLSYILSVSFFALALLVSLSGLTILGFIVFGLLQAAFDNRFKNKPLISL